MNTNGKPPKIGVAMIARNAEDLIPTALDPLVDVVDEIAIVLGGVSTDNTAELADKYATLPVQEYVGPILEDGALAHFGMARNQSFQILKDAGIDYALVVDTDDQWEGVETLPKILAFMAEGDFPMVLFKYSYEGGDFMQPRIYKISSGYWANEGPCHNFWEIPAGQRVAMQTDMMSLRQVRTRPQGDKRRHQNIEISIRWMAEHGDDCRLLQHMAKDLMVDRDFERATDALDRYFVAYESDSRQDPEELYTAHHTMASIHIMQGRFDEAFFSELRALAIRPHAQSWTLASEAAGWWAKNSRLEEPLLRLSIFCAEQALMIGKSRQNLHWHSEALNGALPLLFKSRALVALGRPREALGPLDLAIMIEPENEEATVLRKDICRQLGELG